MCVCMCLCRRARRVDAGGVFDECRLLERERHEHGCEHREHAGAAKEPREHAGAAKEPRELLAEEPRNSQKCPLESPM